MSDLERLFVQPVALDIHNETLMLVPLKVGQIPPFVRALSPILQQMQGKDVDWLMLLGERGEEILDAISIACGQPRTWVNQLEADEALLLGAKLVEINADFFTRQVLPRFEAIFPNVTAPGSTPSSA
jgi:hypothetical protein